MKGITGILTGKQTPVCSYVQRNPKFQQEKVCAETERWLVHFDGILLSHPKPVRDGERFDLLTGLYAQYGAAMTAHLKGQYNLVVWDKQEQKVLVANDLLSKRPLYYCMQDRKLLYAASYEDLLDMLSGMQGYAPAINAEAIERMALTGALGGVQTYLSDVCYLEAYQALVFDLASGTAEAVTIQPEGRFSASTMEEAVSIFDRLFTNAVRAQFDKNIEYGYGHFMALSGGMDSRACLLKAVASGYDRAITCFTYSQAGSIDDSVSRQIAFDNRLDYLFYPMDAAVFMTRLEDALRCNECQQSSIGSTGARTIARLLDKTGMGIVHVGLCGGELMGDLVTARSSGGRMRAILTRLGLADSAGMQFAFNRRDYLDNLRACQNFSQMFLDGCETVSPFMDEDVVQFVSGLDPKLLYRRSLYREWMKKNIPNDYPTTYFCGPITISPVREVLVKLIDRVIRRVAGSSRRDMNPIDHWLKIHPHLAQGFEEEYRSGMEELTKAGVSGDVTASLQKAWTMGAEQRLYALTAIAALKMIVSRFPTI